VRRDRAFSLLEVLIAIALTIALLGALFGFLWNLLSIREDIETRTAHQRAASALLEALERDLFTSLVGDPAMGAGFIGEEASFSLLTRSVPVRLAEQIEGSERAFADLERTEYRFEPTGGRLLAGRIPARPGGLDRVAMIEFGDGIHSVRFRYHDGLRWRDSFDSLEADALPRAIEVAIWFRPWPGAAPPPHDEASEAAGDEEPERSTFDADAGFDEHAFALESDLESFELPPPDRLRVIVIPDAAEPPSREAEATPARAAE